MTTLGWEDLVNLPEHLAFEHRRWERNEERLRVLAAVAALAAFIFLVRAILAADWLGLAAPLFALVISRWTYVARDTEWGTSKKRWFTLLCCVGFFVISILFVPDQPTSWLVIGLLAPLLLTTLRLPPLDAAGALLFVALLTLAPPVVRAAGIPQGQEWWIRAGLQVLLSVAAWFLIRSATQRERDDFHIDYRRESSRDRERQRMRDELASARQIQLSMLPRSDPRVPGMEISSVSLPAAEVGGDYYEYFNLPGGRLGLVVADVAGHGVASGLLLSGIRSCLFLLHHESASPREIVEKLDAMVRGTTQNRVFITLVYAVADLQAGTMVFTTAGHPPPLLLSKGRVTTFDVAALPLGTRLDRTYSETTSPLEPGDVLVFYSDGLTEATNDKGDLYTDDRLIERLTTLANRQSATAVREAILNDVWTFKGNSEQLDDVTLVVIRITANGPKAVAAAGAAR